MYIILINILITYFYLVLRFKKNLHILQQNFYNENNRYIKWGKKNILSVFKYDLIVLIIIIIKKPNTIGDVFFIISLIFFLLLKMKLNNSIIIIEMNIIMLVGLIKNPSVLNKPISK